MASPFVKTVEYDKSKKVAPFKGLYGLVIGNFDKGRVNERMFVSTQQEADLTIGKPTPGCDPAYYILSTYLQKSQRCWVYRVANDPKFASILVGSEFVTELGEGDGTTKSFSGTTKFETCKEGSVSIWIDNSKIAYDDANGNLNGTNLESGTVDYETGEVSFTIKSDADAPPNGSKVYVKWGFESKALDDGPIDLSDYDIYGDLEQVIQEDTETAGRYLGTLTPYPLREPDMDTPVTGVDSSTLAVYDGDEAIAYADEYGNLVDLDAYLAASTAQVTEITCNDGTLEGGEYFLIHSLNPSTTYYVWMKVDGSGSDPTVEGATSVQIDIDSADDVTTRADKIATAIDNLSAFTAVADSVGTVTVTNEVAGYVEDASDESTGFTITIVEDGVSSGSADFTNGEIDLTVNDSYTVSNDITVKFQSRSMYYAVVAGDSPGKWINNEYSLLLNKVDIEKNTFSLSVFENRDNRSSVMVDSYVVSNEHKLDGFDQQMYMEDRINDNSYYIRTKYNDYIDEIDDVYPREMIDHNVIGQDYDPIYFDGGDEGGAVTVDDYINALKEFDNKDDIKVHIFMDNLSDPQYQNAIIRACDRDFGGRADCYGVLQVPFDIEMNTNYINDAIKFRKYTLMTSTSFAGLYFGHVKIRDTYNSRNMWVPSVGFVGAAFSYSADQYAPWFPAAGWNRGKILVDDIYRKLSQGQRDALYDNDINAMKFKPGRGIAIWGQKTLYGVASALDRANVRWLLIVAENAIEDYLEDYEFEINDSITRASVKAEIESYLKGIQLERGLYGFDVVCDTTNNPPATIDDYIMNVDYYLQPTKAAEFIYARAVITRTGVNFEDVRIT